MMKDQSEDNSADIKSLIQDLRTTESIFEQGDIIFYIYKAKSLDFQIEVDSNEKCTVRDLIKEIYSRAGDYKHWWLVRHFAGMLGKQADSLAKSVSDLLVRQKQITVGSPHRELVIDRPLPPHEICDKIRRVCQDDYAAAMLTQELIVYLAMYVNTEPRLFKEMLRLRIGLIIQVMATELAIAMDSTGEEATEQLLNLSPFEMKTLLHHILSGKEFGFRVGKSSVFSGATGSHKSIGDVITRRETKADAVGYVSLPRGDPIEDEDSDDAGQSREGQWLRRRRIDGALNRVPVNFYGRLWSVLQRCESIILERGNKLEKHLVQEMTQEEWKFALMVEQTITRISEPEYRQLLIEGLMVLTVVIESDKFHRCNYISRDHDSAFNEISVKKIVENGCKLFLEEQREKEGRAINCCANTNFYDRPEPLVCLGARRICKEFYDSAPSGRYGTMTYLSKAVTKLFDFPTLPDGDSLNCAVN